MLLLGERVMASVRTNKPTPSQQREMEGEQEAPPKKAPHTWGAMSGTSRQTILQEVIPLGMLTVPPRRPMWKSQEAINYIVIEMIVMDGQPFSFVEDVAFCQLLQHVAPWYSPESCLP